MTIPDDSCDLETSKYEDGDVEHLTTGAANTSVSPLYVCTDFEPWNISMTPITALAYKYR